MEFNKISLAAQQMAALNKPVKKEESKAEDKKEAEVRDNKPAEQQVSGEDVLTFMATKNIDVKVTAKKPVDGTKATEDRISGYMADFEAAFDEMTALGLSEDAIFEIFDRM